MRCDADTRRGGAHARVLPRLCGALMARAGAWRGPVSFRHFARQQCRQRRLALHTPSVALQRIVGPPPQTRALRLPRACADTNGLGYAVFGFPRSGAPRSAHCTHTNFTVLDYRRALGLGAQVGVLFLLPEPYMMLITPAAVPFNVTIPVRPACLQHARTMSAPYTNTQLLEACGGMRCTAPKHDSAQTKRIKRSSL